MRGAVLGPSSKPGSWRLGREAPPEGLKQHGLTSGDVRACGGWVVPREGQGCARIPAQGTGLLRGHSFPGWCWVKYKWCTGSSPARASGAGLPAPPDSATGVQEVREGDGNFLASQPDGWGLWATAPTLAVSGYKLTPTSSNLWKSVYVSAASPFPRSHPRERQGTQVI